MFGTEIHVPVPCFPDTKLNPRPSCVRRFNHDGFYKEARRVLKPDGALAAWTYDYGSIVPGRACPTNPSEAAIKEVNDAFTDFHSGPAQIGPYWDKRRDIVLKRYETVMPGPEHFGKVQRLPEGIPMDRQWSLNDLVRWFPGSDLLDAG